jgi:hydrogenase maturation factor
MPPPSIKPPSIPPKEGSKAILKENKIFLKKKIKKICEFINFDHIFQAIGI